MTTLATSTSHRYERWTGRLHSQRWTWWPIVSTGLRLAAKRNEMRLFLMAGLMLVTGACAIFYILALLETFVGTGAGRGFYEFINGLLGIDLRPLANLRDYRDVLWRATFLLMIKIELPLVFFVLASAGPGLIAQDIRTRALPIYFARPLQPVNYLMGKGLVVALLIGAVTVVPNLASLFLGTLLSGGPPSIWQTLALAGRLLLIGVGVMVIGSTVILALSSLGSEKRYATFGWLAICLIPMAIQSILDDELAVEQTRGFLGSLTLHRNVAVLAEWLLDLRRGLQGTSLPSKAFESALGPTVDPMYPAIVLGLVVLVSSVLCYRRVVRFSRAAANV